MATSFTEDRRNSVIFGASTSLSKSVNGFKIQRSTSPRAECRSL